jgi:DNA-binding MurR/RpiR family transcriptional regulator
MESSVDGSSSSNGSLRERITARIGGMTRAERRVAEYLRDNAGEVIFATAEQIGAASKTSDATVVRTAKTLGYSGLLELKYSLGKQVLSVTRPSVRLRNRLVQAGAETDSMVAHVFGEAVDRLTETRRLLEEEDFVRGVDALADAREVLAIGFGPSELAARHLALRLGRLGRRARSTGASGYRIADDLLALTSEDLVVLYVPGRRLDEVDVVLDHASSLGARTMLFSDLLRQQLESRVDLALPAVLSPSGFTGEMLSALVLTDALVLGLAARDRERATDTSELLTQLRRPLLPADAPKRDRTQPEAENP